MQVLHSTTHALPSTDVIFPRVLSSKWSQTHHGHGPAHLWSACMCVPQWLQTQWNLCGLSIIHHFPLGGLKWKESPLTICGGHAQKNKTKTKHTEISASPGWWFLAALYVNNGQYAFTLLQKSGNLSYNSVCENLWFYISVVILWTSSVDGFAESVG